MLFLDKKYVLNQVGNNLAEQIYFLEQIVMTYLIFSSEVNEIIKKFKFQKKIKIGALLLH